MLRLFIAIDFPPEIVERLADICHSVRGARWVPPHQFHCTLRFIGEVGEPTYHDIVDSLGDISLPSFTITLSGTGYFPPSKSPRVLWAGIRKSEELHSLFTHIEECLELAGIEPDKRKFHPHVTLARFRHAARPDDVVPFLSGTGLFSAGPVSVTEFHLYSSILRPEGPEHRREATYQLLNKAFGSIIFPHRFPS